MAARPSAKHQVAQQEKFDDFGRVFNQVRPHEALRMKTPADLYRPSSRSFDGTLPDVEYRLADDIKTVDRHGKICLFGRHTLHISTALADQSVAIAEQPCGLWTIGFALHDLGTYDSAAKTFSRYSALRPSSLGASTN